MSVDADELPGIDIGVQRPEPFNFSVKPCHGDEVVHSAHFLALNVRMAVHQPRQLKQMVSEAGICRWMPHGLPQMRHVSPFSRAHSSARLRSKARIRRSFLRIQPDEQHFASRREHHSRAELLRYPP